MAKAQALMSLAAQVGGSLCVAYSDAFWIVGVGLIISLSAIVLLKRPRRTSHRWKRIKGLIEGDLKQGWSKSGQNHVQQRPPTSSMCFKRSAGSS